MQTCHQQPNNRKHNKYQTRKNCNWFAFLINICIYAIC